MVDKNIAILDQQIVSNFTEMNETAFDLRALPFKLFIKYKDLVMRP